MIKSLLIAFIMLVTMAAAPSANLTASIVLNGSNPLPYDSTVTFTLIYPQEAAKQSRQPQYPDQPLVQVDCYQVINGSGTRVFTYNTVSNPRTKDKIAAGWWTSQSYPVPIHDIAGYNGLPAWDTTQTAFCGAILYSFDVNNQGHVWAQVLFDVSAL